VGASQNTLMADVKPNTLRVQETRREEVAADRADLHVTIEGASLVTGQQALHKAREVATLVQALTEYGLSQSDVYLQGVSADTAAGLLGSKASTARYRLRVHCARLETLADLIGIVTSQKNATLNLLTWGYPDDDEDRRDGWLRACVARANAKAALIADALGVRLLGVHSFSEKYGDGETPLRAAAPAGMERSRMARVSAEELGLEVSHTKTLTVSVDVEYLVSGFE